MLLPDPSNLPQIGRFFQMRHPAASWAWNLHDSKSPPQLYGTGRYQRCPLQCRSSSYALPEFRPVQYAVQDILHTEFHRYANLSRPVRSFRALSFLSERCHPMADRSYSDFRRFLQPRYLLLLRTQLPAACVLENILVLSWCGYIRLLPGHPMVHHRFLLPEHCPDAIQLQSFFDPDFFPESYLKDYRHNPPLPSTLLLPSIPLHKLHPPDMQKNRPFLRSLFPLQIQSFPDAAIVLKGAVR